MSRIENHLDGDRPLILSLDTSSKLTSIAVSKGQELVVSFGAKLDENRSTRLWSIIDFLLSETGLKIEDVGLFAVCVGPGGFTGLRVGLTATKGLAAATGRQVFGVTSLAAAAAAVGERATPVYVVQNAYKGEVFSQLFSFDTNGLPVAANEPLVGGIDEALERVNACAKLTITGDAAALVEEKIREFSSSKTAADNGSRQRHWEIQSGQQFLAAPIARIAYFGYKADRAMQPEALEACYIRGADIKVKQQV